LKERYEGEPEAALVTLKASGSLGDGISCTVNTGRALAEAGLHPASGGDGSLRGTLAVDRDAPVGFRAIRLRFELETEADEEELATLLKLTERYCVVLQTLASPPELSASVVAAT